MYWPFGQNMSMQAFAPHAPYRPGDYGRTTPGGQEMSTIYTMGGERIADATLEFPINGSTAQLRGLPRSNGLLNYYFGQGGRKVLVETEAGKVEARLNTRWERFGRAWEIVLAAPSSSGEFPDEYAEDERTPETPGARNRTAS